MALDNTWRTRKQCAVVWLDIPNTFGSVPHHHILGTLRELGLPEDIIDLVQELYNSCTITIQSTKGETDKISIQSGVRQDCPLSPIIFNLAMQPFLQAVVGGCGRLNLYDQKLSILTYANNLILLTNTAAQMQQMLDVTSEAARWMGLCFSVAKCTSLFIDGRKKSHILESTLTIQGQAMRHLHDGKVYCHFGMPTGHQTTFIFISRDYRR
ncbi:hypothetical protein Y1Q_0012474 [Alligator mississippiensis]|uniref:Reverse transcriptase domain-containing protein n=1 Tax=Alligator mississippiensis TaxID=8496 RepID=A0A151M7S0_ALLMI|nr:hypothetical protein Y1Q_0012474 [Alligator mississippiensis]